MKTKQFYSEIADQYDTERTLERLPDRFRELLDEFVDLVDDERVLDAGCGPGRDVNYFTSRGLEAVGVDIAPGMIRYAEENRNGAFQQEDIRDLSFADHSFDGVWCCASLFLMPPEDWEDAVDELRRVLRPDGILYLNFKKGEGVVTREHRGNEIRQWLTTKEEISSLLTDFDVVSYSENSARGSMFGNFFCRKTS